MNCAEHCPLAEACNQRADQGRAAQDEARAHHLDLQQQFEDRHTTDKQDLTTVIIHSMGLFTALRHATQATLRVSRELDDAFSEEDNCPGPKNVRAGIFRRVVAVECRSNARKTRLAQRFTTFDWLTD